MYAYVQTCAYHVHAQTCGCMYTTRILCVAATPQGVHGFTTELLVNLHVLFDVDVSAIVKIVRLEPGRYQANRMQIFLRSVLRNLPRVNVMLPRNADSAKYGHDGNQVIRGTHIRPRVSVTLDMMMLCSASGKRKQDKCWRKGTRREKQPDRDAENISGLCDQPETFLFSPQSEGF